MLIELAQHEFEQARALFAPLAHQPMCMAVLAGVYPGRLFVDDRNSPRSACLTTYLTSEADSVWAFLAGEPANKSFNAALNQGIVERGIISDQSPVIFFTCQPETWGDLLRQVTTPHEPVAMSRRHYTCRQLEFDWRAAVPAGYTVRPMNAALLEEPALVVPGEVRTTLAKWRAIRHPRFSDFGVVAVCQAPQAGDPLIVSWATVDFVAGGAGDIGFETVDAYRKRGLATVVAAAALEHGLASGLSEVHWTCAESNAGSIRLAEKLGLEHERDYNSYLLFFDEAGAIAQQAYEALLSGNYQRVVVLLARFFELKEDPPAWAYVDLARARAGLNDPAGALANLESAAKRGWRDGEELQSYPEFAGLWHEPGWTALAQRMSN